MHAWVGEKGATIFVGGCEPSQLRREKRVFERVAMSFRFFNESEVDADKIKWEHIYKRTSLAHKDERVAVAVDLVDGWLRVHPAPAHIAGGEEPSH